VLAWGALIVAHLDGEEEELQRSFQWKVNIELW
jgi:hypothetical protein